MGEARDLVEKFYATFASNQLDEADSFFADDCRFVVPAGRMNKAEHRVLAETFLGAMPDAHMEINHAVENGDEVVVEGRFIGTHTGDLVSPQGTIPPTGKTIDVRFADYYKMSQGTITEQRTYWDQMEMMGQLGLM